MEKIVLNSESRTIMGKQVRKLRREGKLPANLFGKNIDSAALTIDLKEFSRVYNEAGSTGVVELKLAGKTHPILISAVQADPRTDVYLHADLHEVNLKEKIVASVPVVLDGESPAEKSGVGTLIHSLSEVEVESLPTDIPHELIVDISHLEEVGQSILVKDLNIDKAKVELKTDPETTVVSVQEVASAEPEEETPTEEGAEPEVIGEKAEEESEEKSE